MEGVIISAESVDYCLLFRNVLCEYVVRLSILRHRLGNRGGRNCFAERFGVRFGTNIEGGGLDITKIRYGDQRRCWKRRQGDPGRWLGNNCAE